MLNLRFIVTGSNSNVQLIINLESNPVREKY